MVVRPGLLACFFLTVAAAVHAERLPIRTYTNLDGLAHVRITCVVSDSRGFIWFCGPDGLSRFDGQRFTTYGASHGLGSTRINDFIETHEGIYWVATNGAGVYRYLPVRHGPVADPLGSSPTPEVSRFQRFSVGEDPRTERVNVLYQDRSGRLWAGTDGGLFRFTNAAFEPVSVAIPGRSDDDVQIWAIDEDRRGHLWIGTSWGLVERVADGRMLHSTLRPTQGSDHVRAVLIDRDDRVWIGHATGVARLQPGSTMAWLTSADGLAPGMVRDILQSSDGHIWIATLDGLTEIDGTKLRTFTSMNGVGKPNDLAEDDEGNIWIGTLNGAQRFSRGGFRTYTEFDGLADLAIRAVFEDAAGHIYAVSLNQRVYQFDGIRFTGIRPNLIRDAVEVTSGHALRDRMGEWWIAGAAGVYRFPRVTMPDQLAHVPPLAIYSTRNGLAGDDVMRLFEDSRGDIWIARRYPTAHAAARWNRSTNTFDRLGIENGLPANSRIESFAEDRAGNVWVGFQNGGVARYRHGRFTFFTGSDGAPTGPVPALYVDGRGRLWVGSDQPTLSRIDDPTAESPRFVPVAQQRLSGDFVTCITEDRFGRLYLCTLRSPIDRLDPDTGELRPFTAADGLAGADMNNAFRDHQGNIWLASNNGILRLVPTPDEPKQPPSILIEAIRVAGERYLVSDMGERDIPRFELGAGKNRLQIAFFALGSGPGSRLRYQYRLEGLDDSWNAPTDRRDVDYGSLAPGRYRFIVRAVGPDEALGPQAATVEFTILSPIWQRWWFQSGVAATVILMAWAAHRIRVRQLLALQHVRMSIAADLHDDIGGSLSRIAIQSEVAVRDASGANEPPTRWLGEIAQSARDVVDSLGDVVWAVDPRRDDLGSVFRRLREYGEDVIAGNGTRWFFSSSGDLGQVKLAPQARRHLFLLFKEALTNIGRHAAANTATMDVALAKQSLRVELRDDGEGFDAHAHLKDGVSPRHGLESMHARAQSLGGSLRIESTVGNGTSLVLTMTLPGRWRRMIMLLRHRSR